MQKKTQRNKMILARIILELHGNLENYMVSITAYRIPSCHETENFVTIISKMSLQNKS